MNVFADEIIPVTTGTESYSRNKSWRRGEMDSPKDSTYYNSKQIPVGFTKMRALGNVCHGFILK